MMDLGVMNRQFRVLLVLDGMNVGGTETYALTIARELLRQEITVVIVGNHGPLHDAFVGLGCSVYLIDFVLRDALPLDKSNHLVEQIKQIMIQEQITVVHIHQTPSGRVAVEAASQMGIPVVFTVHGTYYPHQTLFALLEKSAATITVSPPIYNLLEQNGISSSLIPNGIDLNEFKQVPTIDLRQALDIPSDAPVILYASRLSQGKSTICRTLIKACKYLQTRDVPNLHLVIAGDGARFDEIQNYVQSIHRSSKRKFVHLLGQRLDMRNCYAISQCVVGTGRVALEAMACEKPVVAIGSHGFFGLVKPTSYQTAWNCYFGDHLSLQPCTRHLLCKTLREALSSSDSLQIIGKEGKRWVEQSFSSEQVTSSVIEVYRSVQ